MNNQPDTGDDLRDPQLAKWYREGTAPEPSAALDQAILAAAHREVRARPRAAGSLLRRWRVPLSLAAVLVLSVTVVTLVHEREGELAPGGAPRRPEERAARVPEPPRPDRASGENIARKLAAPEAANARPPQATAATPPAATPTPVAPAPAAPAREEAEPLKDAPRARAAAGPAPAEPFPSPAAVPGSVSAPASQTAPRPAGAEIGEREDARRAARARDDAAGGGSPPAKRAEIQEQAATPGLAAPAAKPSPAAPPAASPPAVMRQESAATESRSVGRLQAPRQSAVPSSEVAQLVKGLDQQPPDRWLDKIEELRRAGRNAESDELLAEFKKRFPGHPGAAAR